MIAPETDRRTEKYHDVIIDRMFDQGAQWIRPFIKDPRVFDAIRDRTLAHRPKHYLNIQKMNGRDGVVWEVAIVLSTLPSESQKLLVKRIEDENVKTGELEIGPGIMENKIRFEESSGGMKSIMETINDPRTALIRTRRLLSELSQSVEQPE